MSKEITKYWEETCIDFGKYVYNNRIKLRTTSIEIDELWLEFQEQMAKDVDEVLDGADRCEKDNTLNTNKQEGDVKDNFTTDYVKAKLEEAEVGGFYDGIPRDALNMKLKQEKEYKTLADAHQEERADQYEGKTITGGLSPDTGPRN